MLPYLKNRREGSMSESSDALRRPSDEDERNDEKRRQPFELLDAVVDDMMEATIIRDRKLLKSALEVLCFYLRHN